MAPYSFYISLAFMIGAVCTAIIIPLIIAFCRKFGFYDQPNERKVHHAAIPRLGGLAFLPSLGISFLTVLLIYATSTDSLGSFHISAAVMVLGACIIYLIGLLDDLLDLHATTKFIIMFVASAFIPLCNLVIGNLHGLFGIYELPLWVGYGLTVLVIMTLVNALNLIDGIDGLSSGISIIALCIYTYCFIDLRNIVFSVASAGLLGAVVMFFFYNVFGRVGRLKIFMGDAGSLILGYVLSYLSIKYTLVCEHDIYTEVNPLLLPMSIFLVPVLDLIRVALTRLMAGEPMFKADRRHIHHVLMSAGLSMHQTLCIILGLVAGFIVLNLWLEQAMVPLTVIFLLDLSLFIIFFVVVYSVVHRRESMTEMITE
ncbi:MAG: undecaprenyl/decaprenyl-phosphate alpha-N-acetylglucosaminyl 1-phosphate transferase [Bacteroidaceae bacterium]|nr:undecaprenyl/decaprenyl-phosphate alpha-N-acetylglucosaminyl 1-phosphate transferase [Bacteroidaceae bacterium]